MKQQPLTDHPTYLGAGGTTRIALSHAQRMTRPTRSLTRERLVTQTRMQPYTQSRAHTRKGWLAIRVKEVALGANRKAPDATTMRAVIARRISLSSIAPYIELPPMAHLRPSVLRRLADDRDSATAAAGDGRVSSRRQSFVRARSSESMPPTAFSGERWLQSGWRNAGLLDPKYSGVAQMRHVGYRANDLRFQYRASALARSNEIRREPGSVTQSAVSGGMRPERLLPHTGTYPAQESAGWLQELVPRMVLASLASADATYTIERRLRRTYEQRESLENYRMGGDA
jgi:hypothetical protein